MGITTIILFIAGLILLIVGAEILVRGASRLATAMGISPLVVGLTVVAFGTSSPELAVSIQAALKGQADIALGNVIGSNIFNVLFILGLSAAILPLAVSRQLVRVDVPIMIGVSFLMLVLALDNEIGRPDGMLLFAAIFAYTTFLIIQGRKNSVDEATPKSGQVHATPAPTGLLNIAMIVAGLLTLALGSRWLINGAIEIARIMGVSELIIGLTIVAAGTSLPEVATSVIAALRQERDIAVGNVVGSNIFNILAVLGLAGIVAPSGINVSTAALGFDIPVMIAVAVACLPIFFTGHLIARWEGVLFLSYYAAYTAYLILNSTQHAFLPVFSTAMMTFVVPMTLLTLLVLVVRQTRKRQ